MVIRQKNRRNQTETQTEVIYSHDFQHGWSSMNHERSYLKEQQFELTVSD